MKPGETIHEYDLVEVIRVPAELEGVIDVGDIGVVIEKYNDDNFEIECVEPGGSYKWLEPLNIEYIRLKSRDPFRSWTKSARFDRSLLRTSVIWGAVIGGLSGAVVGAGLGAITRQLNTLLVGLAIGLLLGVLTGAITGALTVRTAGTTGGVGTGYYTGMIFGGVFGILLGALIPDAWRMSIHTEGLPVLDAFVMGRFQTSILMGFVFSILDTIVGVWIGGKNFVARTLQKE